MKDLLAWFALKRFPFDKNINTRHVMDTKPLKEAIARLDYIKRRGGILLLTGDPGVGKTLTLRRYVKNLNDNLFKTCYTPLSTLSRSDLLYHLNRLLGLPARLSKSAIYSQIQQALLESKEQMGKTVLLILDEAHLLQTGPLEELRLLTNFKMDSYDPFILVLAGQSDLRRIMEFAVMEPLNQRIAMRYHMPGLALDECKKYISHHLKLAGAAEPILDQSAIEAVHEISFGIPRKIGTITEQALTYAMFDHKRNVTADMVLKVKKLEG
ncbi:MAG: AAA family ATPase [Desulfobacterales bacterium]|nr:AAA family ATPase [Desulfobacterales bacterium]MDH4010315.1 AAA family ATPase [Desulfobacterales bacterium]